MTYGEAEQAAKELKEYLHDEIRITCVDLSEDGTHREKRHALLYLALENWLDE